MIRLFLGLALPADLRERLSTVQNGVAEARWEDPADLHITMRFIGEIQENMAEDLHDLLSRSSLPGGPVTLHGFGGFRNRRGVRTLQIEVIPTPTLIHLHEKCESLCHQAGLPPRAERYHPHVTLARFSPPVTGRIETILAANADWPGGTFTPPALTLFRSHLGRSGPRYEELAAYPLSLPPLNGRESGQTG